MDPESPDSYKFEREIRDQNYRNIIGIDEVGRGPLAGPVVAAAVIIPTGLLIPNLTDSKKLSHSQRFAVYNKLKENSNVIFSIAEISSQVIDKINILRATHLAMKKAAEKIRVKKPYILVDGLCVPNLPYPSKNIIKGDTKSASIAAASIIAKIYRDNLMMEFDKKYPEYGFASHKGYATKKHLENLSHFGPCPIHRVSFSPVSQLAVKKPAQGILPL